MGDDAARGDQAAVEQVDGERVAIGTEMRAVDVELLAVADDAPVRRHVVTEHAELDEAAELADHVEALHDACRIAGRLDVDVATIAVGHGLDRRDDVFLEQIHDHVSTEFLGELKSLRLHVEDHKLRRVLQPRRADHPKAERTGAGKHHHIVKLNEAAIDRMDRARVGLNQHCLVERHLLRNLERPRRLGEAHVFGHGAIDVVLKAINVVPLAHPVFAALAISAFFAGHDLL